jgi:hypothetical protein
MRKVFFIDNGKNLPDVPNLKDYNAYMHIDWNAIALVENGIEDFVRGIDNEDEDDFYNFVIIIAHCSNNNFEEIEEFYSNIEVELIDDSENSIKVRYKGVELEIFKEDKLV